MPHANRGIGRRDMLLLAGGAAATAAVTDTSAAHALGTSARPLPRTRPSGDARGARIDVHHHYTSPAWVRWAEGKDLINPAQLPWWTRWDRTTTLKLMDDAGIATSVLSLAMPVRRFKDPAQVRESVTVAFEAVTELTAAHPDRFSFFAPIFTDDLETSRHSFTRGLDELGALGVQTRASTHGVYLGDPSHNTLLAELNERSAVINTHPLDLPGADPTRPAVPGVPSFLCDFPLDTTRAAVNLILNGTLDRFPNLSFILPHGGGFLPYIASRAEAFAGFLTPAIEPSRVRDYLHRFYYDTAAPMGPESLATLLTVTDPSRLLYGSDWPATPATTITDFALPALDNDHTLTPRQRRHINRDNALRLMPALNRTGAGVG
ncbi:amidohydrolase family protein [Streptomyces albipurpureus]|uniref:amidohydrolase family protein n=1 Tax=Streptomyces albipurpureus TaxID=2897419 RepID=UPI002556BC74|nr:amidohydrolase family protein [Streptomyces sp. CWNU-1]